MENSAELLAQILNDSNEMIQVSDAETFSMMYANYTAKKYTGHEEESYRGSHCYEYMMGLKEKCPFCPMRQIGDRESYETEVDNGKEVYAVKTKKIKWEGKDAFIEYAWDITDIRRSQQAYELQVQTLIASIPNAQGIFHLDITENAVISVNGMSGEIARMEGLSEVDTLIRTVADYVPEKEKSEELYRFFCRANLLLTYESGKTEFSRDTFSYFDDKSIRPVRITARFIVNPGNNHLECIIYGVDISAEWKEHRKFEKERDDLLAIFDALADAYTNVLLIDAEASKIKVLKVDGFVNMIFNKSRDEFYDFDNVKDQYVRYRVHPKDQEMMDQALSLETIIQKLASDQVYKGNYIVQEDGKTHYFQFKFVKLPNIKYIIGGFQNTDEIVEKQLAQEKEKQEKEEAYQRELKKQLQVINALGSEYKSLYLIDSEKNTWKVFKTDGSVVIQNALDRSAVSDNYDEAIHTYIMNFVGEEDREYLLEHANLKSLLAETPDVGIYSLNYERIVGDEQQHWQANTAKFTADDGKVYLVIGFRDVHDIVEKQLRQESALRDALILANRAKTTFLNNMSHDIRTPMNAIIGFTALAQTRIGDSSQVRDYLEKIHTSSTHLLGLINEILDMSRIESGIVKLEENTVYLPDVLDGLQTIIQGQVEEKQQTLSVEMLNVTNEYVITDKLRLNQVLLNIVGNAVKYTDCGGRIHVRVEEKPGEKPGYVTCEFRVRDNGMGMSKEFAESVFDIFSRERTSTISGIQGTGLGMSIAKNNVDMMNGTITVESELGKGSEFVVTVDFKLAETGSTTSIARVPDGQSECGSGMEERGLLARDYSGKRILLVEDNELNREIATVILKDSGMLVDTAEDGTEAVSIMDRAPQDRYDLILMDIQMPKMDGYTATREIRTFKNNKKANIPIVAMTANAFDEDRKKSFEAGMNGHIAKPIDMSEMADVLDEIFCQQSS